MKPRSLAMLFRQDLTIAMRNSLVWFMLFTVVLMFILVRFALPEGWEPEQAMFWHDATNEQVLAAALKNMGREDYLLDSREAVEEAVKADKSAVGAVYTGSISSPQVTLITNGNLSPERVNIIQASLEQFQAGLTGTDRTVAMETLRPGAKPIPRNMAFLPIVVTFEVLITGFLLVAVLMFQEKQDGSIRAFRISPGTAGGYILSKTLVFTLLGLIYGSVLILATMGPRVNWPIVLGAMALGAAFYTLLGIAVAVFFSNLSEWFVPGLAVLVLNFLPIISYALPTFSPEFMTWIPSYHAVFGMGEILFPTGSSLTNMVLYLGIGTAAAYALCHLLVTKKLMKEGR